MEISWDDWFSHEMEKKWEALCLSRKPPVYFYFQFLLCKFFLLVAHYCNTLCEVKLCSSSLLKMTSHLSYKYQRMFKHFKFYWSHWPVGTIQFDCCKHIIQDRQNIRNTTIQIDNIIHPCLPVNKRKLCTKANIPRVSTM